MLMDTWKTGIGYKSEKQKKLANINRFFNGINDANKFIDDYSSLTLEVKHKSTRRIRLKMLTPNWMLQKLPIDLARTRKSSQ